MTYEEYKDKSDLEKLRLWCNVVGAETMLYYIEEYVLKDDGDWMDLFYELERIYGFTTLREFLDGLA